METQTIKEVGIENTGLEGALKELLTKRGYEFSLDSSVSEQTRSALLTFRTKGLNLAVTLEAILRRLGLQYQLKGELVVICSKSK
jgi:hypothetical protein